MTNATTARDVFFALEDVICRSHYKSATATTLANAITGMRADDPRREKAIAGLADLLGELADTTDELEATFSEQWDASRDAAGEQGGLK